MLGLLHVGDGDTTPGGADGAAILPRREEF
jgi:hypothetical protein